MPGGNEVVHIDPLVWGTEGRLMVLGQTTVGRLLIQLLLLSGKSIKWVSEVLTILHPLTGDVWGFNYSEGSPHTAVKPIWLRWREQGYQMMMDDILIRLKGSELPTYKYGPFKGDISARAYMPAGGDSPIGRVFYYPSRIYRTLLSLVLKARRGWKPKLVLSSKLDERDEIPYVYPPGFENQDEGDFSLHLRTWADLLSIPQLLPLFSEYEDRYRTLFEGSFFALQTRQSPSETLEELVEQLPVVDLQYRNSEAPFPTVTFSSPLDSIWKNRDQLALLTKLS